MLIRVELRRAWTFVAVAATLAVGGCSTLQGVTVAAPPQGGAVVVQAGAPLVVSLPADPAAGYGWVLKGTGPHLRATGGPDYMPSPKPAGATGEAGSTVYRFRALSPGTSALEFAWEVAPGQPAAPDKVMRYQVTIDRPGLFATGLGSVFVSGSGAYWR